MTLIFKCTFLLLISSLIARGSRKPEFESFMFVETYFKTYMVSFYNCSVCD